ncbi:hypothetical protein AB0J80_08605 [Actinoplanes sp. NPDC049548]|uniref:hypothetical protein n=1 Tax=Actinoplanes sp. NPDC049548 TaxID=3155152 RepID=UPI003416CE32
MSRPARSSIRPRTVLLLLSVVVVGLGAWLHQRNPATVTAEPEAVVLASASLTGGGTTAGQAAPLFDLTGMTPGRQYVRCLVVDATSAGSAVDFTVSDVRGALAPWLRMEVTAGTGTSEACDDFAPDGTAFFASSLAHTGTVSTGWEPQSAEQRTFRIAVEVADDPRAADQQAVATLVWLLHPTATPVTPPATNPPAPAPPATEPPATNPPAAEPPATTPPATRRPASGPPTTTPPARSKPTRSPTAKPNPSWSPAPPSARQGWGGPTTLQRTVDLLQGVARNSGFPLLLLLAVFLFLLLQDRVDRKDPKIAHAPLYGDPDQPFPTAGTTAWRNP